MEVDVYRKDGSLSGEKINLSPEIFEIEPNDHAIYQAVRAYLANKRQGTHKTKTFGEVRGSGKKLWRQKHTGRARVGSIRSPLWKGGGAIFGPVPRDYSLDLPKKVKLLARKSALSYKVKEGNIKVVEDFSLESPKTKIMVDILKNLGLSALKVLFLLPTNDIIIRKSANNLQRVKVLQASQASVYELLDNNVILMQKSAVEVLERSFRR